MTTAEGGRDTVKCPVSWGAIMRGVATSTPDTLAKITILAVSFMSASIPEYLNDELSRAAFDGAFVHVGIDLSTFEV